MHKILRSKLQIFLSIGKDRIQVDLMVKKLPLFWVFQGQCIS